MRGLIIGCLLLWSCHISAREFQTEGSDLLMGVGAKQIARGGAVVASDNGVYSMYWNPAGLADMDRDQVAIAGQLDRDLAHVSFAGIAFIMPKNEEIGFRSTVGLSYIPRAYFQADGRFEKDAFETVFVEKAVPGMSGGFDGKLDSETNDYRIGLGTSFDILPELSIGASVGKIKCKTIFKGYMLGETNYIKRDIGAQATSIDIGMKYKLSDNLTFGAVVKNINSDLDVHIVTTDINGSTVRDFIAPFINDALIGIEYRYSDDIDLSIVYQSLYGTYSSNDFDFKIVRLGATYRTSLLDYHAGLIIPIKLNAGDMEKPKLPAPAMPTIGVSYSYGDISLDAVFYIHPIMSYTTNSIKPAVDVSISYQF